MTTPTGPDLPDSIPTRMLVLGMLGADGTVTGDELYAAAETCGQSPEQVRSCLRRLVTEGLLTREGEGRQATFTATPRALEGFGVNRDRTRLAYAQDAALRGWDRRWHLVAFAVPESRRPARDAFRTRLRLMGGAPLQSGLFVSPHAWEDDVRAVASAHDLHEVVTTASSDDLEVGGIKDPRELARSLWSLDELADLYRRFVDDYGGVPEILEGRRSRRERLADATFLPWALAMSVRFSACFAADPLLPTELLPRPWPGREARQLVARSRRLALQSRADAATPVLFRGFDEAIEQLA